MSNGGGESSRSRRPSSPATVASFLGDRLRDVGWSNNDLLVATLGLSGYLLASDVNDIVAGRRDPTRPEYEVIAAALNERYSDLGRDHPMQPWDRLQSELGEVPDVEV